MKRATPCSTRPFRRRPPSRATTASAGVTWDGDPKFEAVAGTKLVYGVNTPDSVLKLDQTFYCCQEGAWYSSSAPTGPWTVCATVPADMYAIPPSCPVYPVTYVYVYDSTPDYVYAGYLPGYTGCYVYGPTVVYGTGWWYHGWHGSLYFPPSVHVGLRRALQPVGQRVELRIQLRLGPEPGAGSASASAGATPAGGARVDSTATTSTCTTTPFTSTRRWPAMTGSTSTSTRSRPTPDTTTSTSAPRTPRAASSRTAAPRRQPDARGHEQAAQQRLRRSRRQRREAHADGGTGKSTTRKAGSRRSAFRQRAARRRGPVPRLARPASPDRPRAPRRMVMFRSTARHHLTATCRTARCRPVRGLRAANRRALRAPCPLAHGLPRRRRVPVRIRAHRPPAGVRGRHPTPAPPRDDLERTNHSRELGNSRASGFHDRASGPASAPHGDSGRHP